MSEYKLLMSPADSDIYKFFEKRFDVLSTDYLEAFIIYERYHADMQLLNINAKLFVNQDCSKLINALDESGFEYIKCDNIGGKYPKNVALNGCLVGNKLFCKSNALPRYVNQHCTKENIEIIGVKQGYAKCSTLVLDTNCIITDDENIALSAKQENIEVLKIEKGDIFLDDKTVGFIGGASAVIGKTVYFFGDIYTHRNHKEILSLIKTKGLNYKCVYNKRLKDIGGIVQVN